MHPLPPPKRLNPLATTTSTESRDRAYVGRSYEPSAAQGNAEQSRSGLPSAVLGGSSTPAEGKKRRKHRGGKRKKNRRQSFAAPSETSTMQEGTLLEDPLIEANETAPPRTTSFYSRGRNANLSGDSLDSEALLDHRAHPMMRPRRESRVQGTFGTSHRSGLLNQTSISYRQESGSTYPRRTTASRTTQDDSAEDESAHDRTPLLSQSAIQKSPVDGYGLFKSNSNQRRSSSSTSSSRTKRKGPVRGNSFPKLDQEYDVNNPPSVPPSPEMHGDHGVDDVMVPGGNFLTRSPDSRRNLLSGNKDALIDIDGPDGRDLVTNSEPNSPRLQPEIQRRRTINLPTSDDVCLPVDTLSELADEDFDHDQFDHDHFDHDHFDHDHPHYTGGSRKRNRGARGYPKLWILDEWSREEKEVRMEGIRALKVSEPVLVGGRLRPSKGGWHRRPEDLPYRFTYFNEEFESTIHAQTISELVQPGSSFRDLFIPDPPELSDSSSDEEEEQPLELRHKPEQAGLLSPRSQFGEDGPTSSKLNSMLSEARSRSRDTSDHASKEGSGHATPGKSSPLPVTPKPKRYGRRPAFWLDVMCPTNQEMQILCKTFGIHALTAEDIMMQEAREKVELFRHYYFINYRTFEQDTNNEDYLEPLNMYVIVFPGGVLSFHFSQSPHPANVRRRIRQLRDYLELSADWIAYGIIDDITDVYQPLIHAIESEVDDIDEQILNLFQDTEELASANNSINDEKRTRDDGSTISSKEKPTGYDLLKRIGECRKKVMSLYRLLGNKADVIKGFAKRCNEQWEVAPKSEIGLYLGDIQDHILTMTSNLSHYETLLSRAHSNYLAQINIRMNERQEKTADILGKLTVVGTIVLPMNIICGMWGMNVQVPGQDVENLNWFWSITAGLAIFALVCFYWCKKVYGIV